MGLFNRLFSKPDDKSDSWRNVKRNLNNPPIIPDLDSIDKVSQISSIFLLVFKRSDSTATKVAEKINTILRTQTSYKNKTLYNSLKYVNVNKVDIGEFDRFDPEIKESLLCICSMNKNGYVREEALRQLSLNPTQFSFPFILFRLGDWAYPVKKIAEKGIRKLIESAEPTFFIQNHKLVDWLLKVERQDLAKIHSEITEFIFSQKNVDQILSSIATYGEGDRYYIIKNLLKKGRLDKEIIESILSDKNYLVRLLAIKEIDFREKPDVLRIILRDRSQKVRLYSINKIQEDQIALFEEELNELILDSSSTIRIYARHLLSKIKSVDYYNRYFDSFKEKLSVGNILGLSETGGSDDIETLKMALTAKYAKCRAAALYGISNIDYQSGRQLAFELLPTETNAIKKVCLSIIPKERLTSDLEKLRSIYAHSDIDTKRFCINIFSKYGGWSVAGDFLLGIQEDDTKLKEVSSAYLLAWYSYSIRLGTEQKENEIKYVLQIQKTINPSDLDIPTDVKRIINAIPYVFSNSK